MGFSSQNGRDSLLRALFAAAQRLPATKQIDFLLRECPHDPELRAEVHSLLNADASGLLQTPPYLSTVEKGTKLGVFELRERIGRGGMGEVWRAHDPRLKRDVALKILPPLLAADVDRVARFEREARAASALNHPNIVSVFDMGHEHGIHWIVSELIDGESLRERLSRGKLEEVRSLAIASQIAGALSAAHAAGIVHRDLKPGNVMLHRDGRVKLVDFGLAKAAEVELQTGELTESGTRLGTAGYMAPEQVRGETIDARADVFSFGVVLYELLSGGQAFSGSSSVELLHAILNDDPAPLPASIPPAVNRIVLRCLEKDPGRRFQSAADLAFTLDSPTSAPASPRTSADTKSRNMIPWVACAAAVVIAGVLGALLLTRPLPAPRVLDLEPLTHNRNMLMLPGRTMLSDGTRLFVWQRVTDRVVQVSVKGGEPVPVDLHLERNSTLLDISPDHNEFLICRDPASTGICELWVEPTVGGTPRRLGNLVSDAGTPASWSPNGEFLAYCRAGNIFLATKGGVDVRKLAWFPGKYVYYPHWSPDSGRLRFSVAGEDDSQIWEVRQDGGGLHRFLPDWDRSSTACCGSWTPDARYFVFLAGGKIYVSREKVDLFHRKRDAPQVFELGDMLAYSPLPSVDGKRLFFVGVQDRGEYLRYDLESGRLSSEWVGLSASEGEFSRDGKYFAFTSKEGTLLRANADGTQQVQLTSPPIDVSLPHWSPDGKQFAFVGKIQGTPNRIYIMSSDGGTPRQVTHGESEGGGDIDASWSPDGLSLAFGAENVKPDKQFIRVLDVKSNRISVLTGSQGMWAPRWSPAGRYVAGLGLQHELVLYDIATRRQTTFLSETADWPSWSKDGKMVFYLADDGWRRVDVQRRKVDRFKYPKAYLPVYDGWFTLSPDGSIITDQYIGSVGIYALDWDLP